VALRVEEHLGPHHAVAGCALEVGPGQVEEILLGAQHVAAGVVQVEEGLQAVEGVGGAQLRAAAPTQRHPVAPRQREGQLGFERAFDVHMQFGLGRGAHGGQQRLPLARHIHVCSSHIGP